jgi:hypothetical protein
MATNIKLKSSALSGKTPTLSDLSLRELAVNTADGKLFLRKGDGSATDKIIDITAPLQASEPMGHEDKTQSTISFNSGTRVFSIQPSSTSFNVWVKGVKYNFTTAQTVTIPNTTGLYYIFFNSDGVLSTRTSVFDWENEAPTAYVYWNSVTSSAPFIADERHGIVLDWQTHEYLHRTRGAVIANGFSLSNYTTTGTGALDSDAQFDISGGTFFDEDLEVQIVHSNTPATDTWQQDLQGPAQIPIFYKNGSGWVRDVATNYALKQGTSRIKYNSLSGVTWSTVDVSTDTYYTSSWIIATNNINYPILAIMGQSESNKISDQESLTFGDLSLTDFPVVEFRPLWKIIWQTDSTYANTPNAKIVGVYDIRQLSAGGGFTGATPVSDHGLLTGLGDDDHLQYIHVTETRTGVTAEFNTTGKITTTDYMGIGTSNPTEKLHITGGGYPQILVEGTQNPKISLNQPQSDATGFDIELSNSYGNTFLRHNDRSNSIVNYILYYNPYNKYSYLQSGGYEVLRVWGDSLNNRAVVIGDGQSASLTRTGTTNQPLQVKGGAYVSGNLGINVTNPTEKLHISGNIKLDETLFNSSSTVITSSTSQFVADSFSSTTYRTTKYLIQVMQTGSSDFYSSEILLIHDGANVYLTEYGTLQSNSSPVSSIDADINSGNVRLLITPSVSNTTTKISRISLTA